MNDVLLSPLRLSELEILIEKSVIRALAKANPPQQAAHTIAPLPPIITKKKALELTGWPPGTFNAKVPQMPEGVVIRGRSKRLMIDAEKFMTWLKTPVQP